MTHLLLKADARRLPLADRSVQCVVTSPPYWGLRDYGSDGQIGLESTPADFVRSMVGVFAEVWRVLRDDGVAFLNLGDTYCNAGTRNNGTGFGDERRGGMQDTDGSWETAKASYGDMRKGFPDLGIKKKDRVGIPHRVVFALQEWGWYWRDEIVWHKPAPMPESVTDRCTKAHEFVFLLTKAERYFFDQEAIKESATYAGKVVTLGEKSLSKGQATGMARPASGNGNADSITLADGRNPRSVWTINTQGFPGAHFATMPPKLAERCIKAGTSERGACPTCGACWRRVVDKDRMATRPGNTSKVHGNVSVHPESPYHDHAGMICGNRDPKRHTTVTKTAGWEPSCDCPAADPVPCVVFDPFNGAGTTGSVATGLGRRYVGTDLNPDYLAMAARRIARPHARIAVAKDGESLPLFTEAS